MNKPKGVISATEDLREKTVLDLLSGEYKKFDLFPAGRLDKDTTGLLLLTTDGKLAHEILSPKKHVTKTYIAVLDKEAQQSDKEAFLEGIVLDDGYKTKPGILEISDSDKHVCTVFISEGKFHQIKRMFADRGKKVLELKRIKMGGLCLDESLLPGEYRELSMEEVEKLFKKE